MNKMMMLMLMASVVAVKIMSDVYDMWGMGMMEFTNLSINFPC